MIKTFTALLELQLGPSWTSLMKDNKPETNLSAVGNLYRNLLCINHSESYLVLLAGLNEWFDLSYIYFC